MYTCIYMYQKFFRTVYQERLVFYYFKNNIKRYQKWGECIYSSEKPKRFQDPKTGPEPWQMTHFICMTLLYFNAKMDKKILPLPLNQILDPPLGSLVTFLSIYLAVNYLKSLDISYFSPTFEW